MHTKSAVVITLLMVSSLACACGPDFFVGFTPSPPRSRKDCEIGASVMQDEKRVKNLERPDREICDGDAKGVLLELRIKVRSVKYIKLLVKNDSNID